MNKTIHSSSSISSSRYTLRITIACPESMISAANQFALAIGESIHDDRTFRTANYTDESGNLYAVASTVAIDDFPSIAANSTVNDLVAARSWLSSKNDEGNSSGAAVVIVDISLAETAQAALVTWKPERENEDDSQQSIPSEPVLASPNAITAVIHDDPQQAIRWMGLKLYSESDGSEIIEENYKEERQKEQ